MIFNFFISFVRLVAQAKDQANLNLDLVINQLKGLVV